MGCCQSEAARQGEVRSEIVGYERRNDEPIFEDNFYIESVERYNVNYKPAKMQGPSSNVHINGGSGASGLKA